MAREQLIQLVLRSVANEQLRLKPNEQLRSSNFDEAAKCQPPAEVLNRMAETKRILIISQKRKGTQTHVRYLADSAALAPHASPGTWRPLASPTLPPKAPRRHQALNPLRALHSPHSPPRRRATPARDPPVPSFNPSPLCFWQNREYSCGSDEVGRGPLDPLRLRLRLDLPSQVSDPPIPLGFHVMRVRMRCFSIEVDGLSWVMRRFWRCRLGGELIGQRGAISLS
jgi:hypothetical protein